jgi:hypothetical protein
MSFEFIDKTKKADNQNVPSSQSRIVKKHTNHSPSFHEREGFGSFPQNCRLTPKIIGNVLRPAGDSIDTDICSNVTSAFNYDFSHVKIHTSTRAANSSKALNALAYTFGDNIVFDQGQYAPRSSNGRQLLSHELTHVIQQSAMPERVCLQRKSRASEVEDMLEWWDTKKDAKIALDLLENMTAADLNETLIDLVKSGITSRLVSRLSRPDIVRFLRLIGEKANPGVQDAVMSSEPLFNLGPENQMIVFGKKFESAMGASPTPPSSSASLVSTDPSAPFTGVGATGLSPEKSPMSLYEMWKMRSQYKEAVEKYGKDWKNITTYDKKTGMEMLYDWSNPIKGGLVGPASYLSGLTPEQRKGQAELLLSQPISTKSPAAYGNTLPSRAQLIRTAAKQNQLEPELVTAIILAEQRDQSKREDAADYQSATMGGSSGASIGLGQVTVKTASEKNLFADVTSTSLQKMLATKTKFANNMIASMLASDDFNIYAVARYIRVVADIGAKKDINSLPSTKTWVGSIDLRLYGLHSSQWTEGHIKLIGSEYTSKPFDDKLVLDWGNFVFEAYKDVKATGIF